MISKSDTIRGTITSLAFGGEGILKHDSFVIFVPFTAIGDELTVTITHVKKSFAKAQLKTIHTPAPSRTQPLCPYFTKCGGCQLQHITYAQQLKAKQTFVQDAFSRILKHPIPIPPIIGSDPWSYRRHIRLQIHNGTTFGYIANDNTTLIQIKTCPIFSPDKEIYTHLHLHLLLKSLNTTQNGSARLFKLGFNDYFVAFSFPKKPKTPSSLPPHISGASIKTPQGTINIGKKAPAPYAFHQANPEIAEQIYEMIAKKLQNEPLIFDLYSGTGLTSKLLTNQGSTVYSVEANRSAHKQNDNPNALNATVEEQLPSLLKKHNPNAILLNPPRDGLSPEIPPLLNAPKILYLSCNPATLARDLRPLLSCGYQILSTTLFDMFPQTTHIETLVELALH